MNVGLVIGSIDAERRAEALGERGLARAEVAGEQEQVAGRASSASAAASALVSSTDVGAQRDQRSAHGGVDDRLPRHERLLGPHEVGPHLGQRLAAAPQRVRPGGASGSARRRGRVARPRSLVMPSLVSSSSCAGELARASRRPSGAMRSSCCSRYGRQASISSGSGRGCRAAGTSPRWRCSTRSRVMPSSSSISWSSSLPDAADERQALPVLLGARALADEHEVGVGVAHAEHDLGAARRPACSGCRCAPRRRAPRGRWARGDATGAVPASTRRPRLRDRPLDGERRPAPAPDRRSASTCPVAAATSGVAVGTWCAAGTSARARPSWPPWATTRHAVLVEPGVGGDDADGRVRRTPAARGRPRRCAAATRGRPRRRSGPVVDVADGVHRDQRRHHQRRRRARIGTVPSPPGRACSRPTPLADGGAGARADRPDLDRAPPAAARQAARPSSAPGRTVGSPTPRSNSDSPTTIGTGPPNAVGKPTPSLPRARASRRRPRPGRTPSRRRAPPRRAGAPCGAGSSSSNSRRGRRAAAHLARGHRALREAHDGASGAGLGVGPVPDRTPVDIGDHLRTYRLSPRRLHRHSPRLRRRAPTPPSGPGRTRARSSAGHPAELREERGGGWGSAVAAGDPGADAADDLVGDGVERRGPVLGGDRLVALAADQHDLVADRDRRRRRQSTMSWSMVTTPTIGPAPAADRAPRRPTRRQAARHAVGVADGHGGDVGVAVELGGAARRRCARRPRTRFTMRHLGPQRQRRAQVEPGRRAPATGAMP